MAVPVFRPSIKRKDMDAVLTCLVSDQLGPGGYSEDLVQALLNICDADAGVVLREQLRGIEIILTALDLPPGSRVAISALSNTRYSYAIQSLGLVPVIVDVQNRIPSIDGEQLRRVHEEEPLHAVILEHHAGFTIDVQEIQNLGIPLIQDISAVLFHEHRDEYAGDFFILALEPENIITTGGGVFIASSKKKYSKALNGVVESLPGDIYLPDMNAALGSIQVKELEGFIEMRKEISGVLQRSIMESRNDAISPDDQLVPSCLPILLNSSLSDAQQYAVKKQIEILPAFDSSLISTMIKHIEFDGDDASNPADDFPNAAKFYLRCALIPLFPSMGRKELEQLQKVVKTLP